MKAPVGLVMKGFPKIEQILLSEEEMQRLYLDGRAIRHYCLQCRGPKFMFPSKPPLGFQEGLAQTKLPEKISITCKTCHVRYTAKLATPSNQSPTIPDARKTEEELLS